MELTQLRGEIDLIDDQLVALFVRRMEVSAAIAQYKQEHGMPIHVPAREQEKLAAVAQAAGIEMADYTQALYQLLFTLSRSYQAKLTEGSEVL